VTLMRFELKVAVVASEAAMTMTVTGEGGVMARIELPPVTGRPSDLYAQEERDALVGTFMIAFRAAAKKAIQGGSQ
jgi:hypothetical protein